MMLGADEIRAQHFDVPGFFTIYTRYCQALRAARQMDYDDQMTYALAILRKHPDVLAQFQTQYPHLCVDESQDTSRVQHAIIRLLAEKAGNLFLVGDEDQSIYGFAPPGPSAAAVPADLPRREAAVHGGELPLHAPDPAGGERLHRQKPQPLPQDHPPRPPRRAAVQQVHAASRQAQIRYLLSRWPRRFRSRRLPSSTAITTALSRSSTRWSARVFFRCRGAGGYVLHAPHRLRRVRYPALAAAPDDTGGFCASIISSAP